MHRFLLLLLFTFLSFPELLFAQVQWGHHIGSVGSEKIEQHSVDADGTIVSVGTFEGTLSIGDQELSSIESSDIFVYKALANGEILWAKAFKSPSYTGDVGVSTDMYGNIYVAGDFIRELFFEERSVLTGNERWNTFLCKLDSEGNLLWMKGIMGVNASSESRVFGRVSSNAEGEVVIAANLSGTVQLEEHILSTSSGSGDNLIVAKYTSGGRLDWHLHPASESNVEVGDIYLDREENVYFTGSYTSTLTLGTEQLNASMPGYGDVFVAKLGSEGSPVWAKNFNKAEPAELNNTGKALAIDPATNELYLAGNFKGNLNLDQIKIEGINTSEDPGNGDIFLAKLASDGAVIWGKRLGTLGHDFVNDLQLSPEEDIVIAGAWNFSPFFLTADRDGGSVPPVLFETSGYGWASGVSPLMNSEYYLSGFFAGSILYGNVDWTSQGDTDGFLFKIAGTANCEDNNNLPVRPLFTHRCEEIRLNNYNGVDLIQWYKDGAEINTGSTQKLSFPKNGTYQASFQNSCGTTFSDELLFDENDFLPVKPFLSSNCSQISIENYNEGDVIRWYRDKVEIEAEFTTEISFPASGSYKVSFQNSCGTTYSDELLFDNAPFLPVEPLLSFSCGEISTTNYNEDDGIKWYRDGTLIEGETSTKISFPENGTYKVAFQNSCGLTYSEEFLFDKYDFLPAKPVIEIRCRKIKVKNPSDYTISWYKNGQLLSQEKNAEIHISTDQGTYTVEFKNACGISFNSATYNLSLFTKEHRIINVITPNGDDKNQFFVLEPALLGSSLEVYNRWGNKVYSKENYQNDWNGQGLAAATYYWKITPLCMPTLRGTVTIIR